jgi:hypothetical protein
MTMNIDAMNVSHASMYDTKMSVQVNPGRFLKNLPQQHSTLTARESPLLT